MQDSISHITDSLVTDSTKLIKSVSDSLTSMSGGQQGIAETLNQNKEWLFSGIGVSIIVGVLTILTPLAGWIIAYLCKKRFLPSVEINGQSEGTIVLHKPAARNLDEEINQAVVRIKHQYPLPQAVSQDPYENPMILVEDTLYPDRKLNAMRYEKELNHYHSEYSIYIDAKLKTEYENQCLAPIHLTLHNKGNKAGENVEVEIEITGFEYVYDESAKQTITVMHPYPPIDLGKVNTAIFGTPSRPSETEELTGWDLRHHVKEKIIVNCGHVNGKKTNSDILPSLYIDTLRANQIVIKTRILSTDNKPTESTITIEFK